VIQSLASNGAVNHAIPRLGVPRHQQVSLYWLIGITMDDLYLANLESALLGRYAVSVILIQLFRHVIGR